MNPLIIALLILLALAPVGGPILFFAILGRALM